MDDDTRDEALRRGTANRVQTRIKLLAAATGWVSSDLYFQTRLPGPNDDAEMEYRDEGLIVAAREFVKAHEGIVTVFDGG